MQTLILVFSAIDIILFIVGVYVYIKHETAIILAGFGFSAFITAIISVLFDLGFL